MSEENKNNDSSSVEGFFDSLIEDFDLEDQGDVPEIPEYDESEQPRDMRDFSKFFEDATAFGNGFQSTIDRSPDDISDEERASVVDFAGDSNTFRKTHRVSDESGMIVIYDAESGIDRTDVSLDELKSCTEFIPSVESAENSVEAVMETVENACDDDDKTADEEADEAIAEAEDTSAESVVQDEETDTAAEESDEAEEEVPVSEAASDDVAEEETAEDKDSYSADSNLDGEADEEEAAVKKKPFISGIIPWKGDSIAEAIRKCVFLVSVTVFVIAGIMLISTLLQSREAQEELEDIKASVTTTVATSINEKGEVETIPPTSEEREEHNESLMNSFVEVSDNVIGFIELDGCNIYYPVVQGKDNTYYLTHTYDDRKNKAGSVFMDYRCVVSEEYMSPNIVLYGHNQEDGTMFGNLKEYKNNIDFYRENPLVSFNTSYGVGDYLIFGYFICNVYEKQDSNGEVFHYHDYIDALNDENTFKWYMGQVEERNQIIPPFDVSFGDSILVLSTCSNEYSDSRFVVMARKVREDEAVSEIDFSKTRLNPNAKQIDWDAILSRNTETTTDTVPVVTTEREIITIMPETEIITTTEPTTTAATTQSREKVTAPVNPNLVQKVQNGTEKTTAVPSDPEAEDTAENSDSASEGEETEETTVSESEAGPHFATQVKR